jgi:hypothetical protein
MLKFQLTQDRCSLIDAYNTGQDIRLWFNLRGRKWEKDGNVNYFTNLEAWKIESAGTTTEPQAASSLPDSGIAAAAADELTNDLPF